MESQEGHSLAGELLARLSVGARSAWENRMCSGTAFGEALDARLRIRARHRLIPCAPGANSSMDRVEHSRALVFHSVPREGAGIFPFLA